MSNNVVIAAPVKLECTQAVAGLIAIARKNKEQGITLLLFV
jgi:hypothetical protein